MSTSALTFASIEELAALLARRKVSPVELTRLYLKRIAALDSRLNSYLAVTAESALAEARAAERELLRGKRRGALQGIPIALKDNIETRGVRTTAGSLVLQDWVPEEDAAVVEKLRRSGAVILGKTNLHEFAYGITGENPHYGAVHNPWDTTRISGGSSSGSAAAAAAGLCAAAIGTDTGGSVRVPAALCGVVGLKPTFGRISRYGVVPLALSFDHMGVLCRSVGDAALLLEALSGYDARDEGSAHPPRGATEKSGKAKKGRRKWRLVRPANFFWERIDPEVQQLAEKALASLERQGAVIKEIALPGVPAAIEAANLAASAEARAFHQTSGYFPARAAEYGEDVRTRLEMGGEVRAMDWLMAWQTIRAARAELNAALERAEAIVLPTAPIAAPVIGAEKVRIGECEQPMRGALLRMNRPANFSGLPAITVPCGFTSEGLPAGLQLIGRAFDESTLLAIAGDYEAEQKWRQARQARPPLSVQNEGQGEGETEGQSKAGR